MRKKKNIFPTFSKVLLPKMGLILCRKFYFCLFPSKIKEWEREWKGLTVKEKTSKLKGLERERDQWKKIKSKELKEREKKKRHFKNLY